MQYTVLEIAQIGIGIGLNGCFGIVDFSKKVLDRDNFWRQPSLQPPSFQVYDLSESHPVSGSFCILVFGGSRRYPPGRGDLLRYAQCAF